MTKANITTVHHRTISGVIYKDDLSRMAAQALLRAAGEPEHLLRRTSVTYKVRFEDETAGSPPYRVGVKAFVEIIEDMEPQAVEAAPAP